MLAQVEGRRHVVLRERSTGHRTAVTNRLRLASQESQDAEFSDAAIEQITSQAR